MTREEEDYAAVGGESQVGEDHAGEGRTAPTGPDAGDMEHGEASPGEKDAEPSGLAGGTHLEEDLEGPSELEILQSEIDQLKDQHLRLAADFENYRKRVSTELSSVWVRARADLIRSIVQGLDDLQRVSQFTSEDTTVDALIEGVDLVERNLLKGLSEAGLVVLNPEGERFDPNTMEAMMRVDTQEDGQDETVHQVLQKGYMFKDQLVRPARVSVYTDED
jgi:molecular chaperone GrpE